MQIRELGTYTDAVTHNKCINVVNEIRAHYAWSTVVYNQSNVSNVYLILDNNNVVGFIDCEYRDLDISLSSRATIFLHEIHIAPSKQGQGIGTYILRELLGKGLNIEMVVVNINANMFKTLEHFTYTKIPCSTDTQKVILESYKL
jgi:ribosomal protein S18 acetylase RimI-like enzyme